MFGSDQSVLHLQVSTLDNGLDRLKEVFGDAVQTLANLDEGVFMRVPDTDINRRHAELLAEEGIIIKAFDGKQDVVVLGVQAVSPA